MGLTYQSTRGGEKEVTASMAILQGLAKDGGLFMPSGIPELDVPRHVLDRCGSLLGNGIWKVYDKSVSLSDG